MRPAIGLTAGGGGGNTRTCANSSRGSTTVAMPAAPTIAIPVFRKRAPACMSAQGLVAVGAADVNRTGGLRPAAAVSEFPPREIGPAHGSDSCIAIGTSEERSSVIFKCDALLTDACSAVWCEQRFRRAALHKCSSRTDYIIRPSMRSACYRFQTNETVMTLASLGGQRNDGRVTATTQINRTAMPPVFASAPPRDRLCGAIKVVRKRDLREAQ